MRRYDILNLIAKKNNSKTYLEIGVRNPKDNFEKIKCETKYGVDPAVDHSNYSHGKSFKITSDDFFMLIRNDEIKFDLIFIDGLHTQEQVDKDILNSLKFLNKNGVIVLHDCNPESEYFEGSNRNGTVWRSIYNVRKNMSYLNTFVINTDYGCGVITHLGHSYKMNIQDPVEINYSFLDQNRKEILNLVSVEDGINIINSW